MAISVLRQLANIILEAVDEIEDLLAKSPSALPSLDVPISRPAEISVYAQIQGPATKIKAACGQLAASVTAPVIAMSDAFWAYHLTSCLKVAGAINVAEVVRGAGSRGLHIAEICEPSGTDPDKIARVLRLLAAHHIFREVKPDVFANNRLSSLLDSGMTVEDLFYRPDRKRSDKFLTDQGAVTAHIELMVDDLFTASTRLTDCLTDEHTAKSAEPTAAALNLAFNTHHPAMVWQQLPENELRKTRFEAAMNVNTGRESPLQGFNWKEMAPGSTLVDVGGGFGALFQKLAQEHEHLKYIVQDQATVITGAEAFWKSTHPEALENGRVKFQVIDFFKPQPVKHASIFILRYIMHDWSEPHAVQILRILREAAQPSTKLVIIDIEVPLGCRDTSEGAEEQIQRKNFPDWVSNPAPEPLLPNYGMGNLGPYRTDMLMLTFNNGKERTMAGFQKLTLQAGWKIEEVYFLPEWSNLQIVACPISSLS